MYKEIWYNTDKCCSVVLLRASSSHLVLFPYLIITEMKTQLCEIKRTRLSNVPV